ncbi:MAG: hypothetical protein ACRC7U_09690 [Moraxella sp.]
MLVAGILLSQVTPAGASSRGVSHIDNMANAIYNVQGQDRITNSKTSNTVSVNVFSLPKYDITLTQPLTITLKPGENVQWQNTLENTGAFDETVAVSFATPNTLSNFQVYVDSNNNGMIDSNETELQPTISIKAGEQIHLIVKALTSADLKDGEKIDVPITAVVQEDNTVQARATDSLVAIVPNIIYKDPTYQTNLSQTTAGEPVYIEVGLAYCNASPTQVDNVWLNVTSKKTGDTIRLKAVETGVNTGKYRISAPTELNANAIQDAIIQTLDADKLVAEAQQCESASGKVTSVGSEKILTDIQVSNDQPALSIDKKASVTSAEIGDFIDYTINIQNVGKSEASQVVLKDDLPLGFTYVKNSVRVNGQKYTQDFAQSGKYMTLGLSSLPAKESKKITYRVALGANALAGTGTNTAFAQAKDTNTSQTIQSGLASAHVKVTAGALNTDGIIIGKVYADFNQDGIQQKENLELGVAGVRLYLEDGTFVVTDSEGKYSIYGQKAKTHVIKLDRTTLPRGVQLIEQTNRNAGDPGSRFVDLRHGELHRADFAITEGIDNNNEQGNPALIAELQKRAKQVAIKNDALEQAIKSDLKLEPTYTVDNNTNIEATGCKNPNQIDGQISCEAVISDNNAPIKKTSELKVQTIAPVAAPEIEKALSTADDKRIEGVTADADFLNLTDKQRVDSLKLRVQIKAPKGANTTLLVNNQPVDSSLMGKEVAWDKEGISGFDYFAVPLVRGSNTLTIRSTDSLGQVVSSKSIAVYAPNQIADIVTRTQTQTVEADGISEYQLIIRLTDTDQGQYAAPATVSLDTDIGTIVSSHQDSNKDEAGVQLIAEGGELLVSVRAPTNPGKGNLVVKAGNLQKIIPLQFIPQLRPMIAAGIVEGTISFNNLGSKIESVSNNDGFEEELKTLSGNSNDDTTTHGRAAFFLKGKVRGNMLLTMAYDSDKNKHAPLFRDIDPDAYYPVYGDASAKGFDAQSSDKLYVRLDKGRSFIMYGDIKTHIDNQDGLSLGQYDRTLTGVKARYENDKTQVTAFAAQTSARQNVNETRGLGISGPYPIGVAFAQLLLNSETVEVIVRDRNNPGVILSRQALNRYSDYELDSVSQAIYLRSPIASTDIDGNPIYLRVTVEADDVGEDYTVIGTAGNHQLTKRVNVGASYAQSNDPMNEETLSGVNTVVKINDKLKLVAEVAHYDSDKINETLAAAINVQNLNKATSGDAARLELTYKDNHRDGKIYYNQADQGFMAGNSPISAGRTETGLKITDRINNKTSLKAEAVQTKDDTNNTQRQGATVSIERKLTDVLTGELGIRYYEKDAKAASTNYQAVPNTDTDNQSLRPSITNNDSHYQGTTLRGKLTADLPKLNKSKVFVEYEQDIDDSGRNAWSVGGETSLMNKGRLYARHELASTLLGDYGLDSHDEHQSTIVGVDANYMKDGQVFSEYRVKDGMSAREAEAAIGLRNKWKVQDGLYINTSFEHLESLEGKNNNTATAATVGVDYLAKDKYKFTTRAEKRWGEQTDTFLHSFGYANKVNDDITLLAKNTFTLQENNQDNRERKIDRFQLGMAYRDYDSNISDHLAKLEYRYDNNGLDTTSPYKKETYIASLHSNYHPVRRLTLSGHYAGKYNELTSDDITSNTITHLVSGRAMYDINERWDAGIQAGTMWSNNHTSNYLLGAEIGYSPMANLWVSAGYNVKGYHDDDIASGSDTQQGAYIRLRFKFDENLFDKNRPAVNSRLMANEEAAVK